MTRKRIKNILIKEWRLLFTDVNSTLIITLLPFLIVGQAMLYIWLAITFATGTILGDPLFQSALAKLAQAMPLVPNLTPREQVQVLFLNQFNFFLLLIPTMIAISVATFSIVDEKVTGSLEALLATPVRTWELLFGKAISGAVPALLMTWISAGAFLLVTAGIGWGGLIEFVVTPAWFLSLFLLTPAVALLSFMLGVIGSSKAKDARSAQTISLVIIFPVMALIALQVIGILWFTPLLTLALALLVGIIDYIVLRMAVHLFQRESIIIRWR